MYMMIIRFNFFIICFSGVSRGASRRDRWLVQVPQGHHWGVWVKGYLQCRWDWLILQDAAKEIHGQERRVLQGTKLAKDRVTVLFACSATGEKLKPLVIGHAENPRCFTSINKLNLPVHYWWNRKSWMTATLFKEWLLKLNNKMKA